MTNQVLRFLYSQINKTIKESSELDFKTFERADKIIIWIVGFSIGIFVLLFTNDLKSINQISITEIIPDILIISLVIVILGLIYRILSFYTQMLYNRIIASFSSYTDSFANTPDFPDLREIKDSDTIEDIKYYLEQDFGIILPQKNYQNLTEEGINEYRNLHLNYYTALANGNNFDDQMNEYKKQIAIHFGLSKKSVDNAISNERKIKIRGIIYRIMLITSYFFFFATIATFILGTIIILKKILELNYC